MENNTLSTKKEININIFYLLLALCYYFITIDFNQPYNIKIEPADLFSISFILIFLCTFYLNYFCILPKLIRDFSWKRVMISYLFLLFFWICTRAFTEQVITNLLWGKINYHPTTSPTWYIFDNLFYSLPSIVLSSILYITIHFIKTTQRNLQYQEEKKTAEIKLLQSQINPHFIFNTLNNIYALVYHKSEKALEGIEKLSELLRFLTYESQQETISLHKEIDYIQNLISLENLRLSTPLNIDLSLSIDNPNFSIPPLLLLPLIENTFKHGITTDPFVPVIFDLVQKGNHLTLYTRNKINTNKENSNEGIGLENTKKRLTLLYPKTSKFTTSNDNGIFTCHLSFTK